MNDQELLPCPFCGEPAQVAGSLFFVDAIVVKCSEGHSNGCLYADRDDAIAAWNRRALPAAPQGWQPIETAPKDAWVLVTWEGGLPKPYENGPWDYGMEGIQPPPAMMAIWMPETKFWRAYSEDGGYYGELPGPTHWMPFDAPLPAPPLDGE